MLVAYPLPRQRGIDIRLGVGADCLLRYGRLAMPRIRYSVESSRAFSFYKPIITIWTDRDEQSTHFINEDEI